MTSSEAADLHARLTATDVWTMLFVSLSDQAHPGKVVAWAATADAGGGTRLPGELVADTLDDLRAMLPKGLTRYERTMMLPLDVVETWD